MTGELGDGVLPQIIIEINGRILAVAMDRDEFNLDRSHYFGDSVSCKQVGGFDQPGDHGEISKEYAVVSWKGYLRFEYWDEEDRGFSSDDPPVSQKPSTRFWLSTSMQMADVEKGGFGSVPHEYAGFITGDEYYRGAQASSEMNYLSVPDWVFLIPVTILALPALLLIPHFRRVRDGFCINCGYDLRGSKDRCPECGEVIPVPAAG